MIGRTETSRYEWPVPTPWAYDGYTWMHEVAEHRPEWRPIPGWGRDGWDLGDWPYVIVLHRDEDTFGVLTFVEGDITIKNFATKEERDSETDSIAFFYWRHRSESWVEGIEPEAIPAHLRGPYSSSRV